MTELNKLKEEEQKLMIEGYFQIESIERHNALLLKIKQRLGSIRTAITKIEHDNNSVKQ